MRPGSTNLLQTTPDVGRITPDVGRITPDVGRIPSDAHRKVTVKTERLVSVPASTRSLSQICQVFVTNDINKHRYLEPGLKNLSLLTELPRRLSMSEWEN